MPMLLTPLELLPRDSLYSVQPFLKNHPNSPVFARTGCQTGQEVPSVPTWPKHRLYHHLQKYLSAFFLLKSIPPESTLPRRASSGGEQDLSDWVEMTSASFLQPIPHPFHPTSRDDQAQQEGRGRCLLLKRGPTLDRGEQLSTPGPSRRENQVSLAKLSGLEDLELQAYSLG